VYGSTSLVLLIDDQTSGVGAILDKARLQGILRGTPSGEVVLEKVMSDETVPAGELVLTSGGDGIFPKGLPVGRVIKVSPGSDLFLNIRVRPAANLSKLEEVLVVTKIDERQAQPDQTGAARAVDILAERLPGVPAKPENAASGGAPGTAPSAPAAPQTSPTVKPPAPGADGIAKTPPQASAGGTAAAGVKPAAVAPAAVKPATNPASLSPSAGSSSASHASNQAAATGSDAGKVSTKPVKAAATPKPLPAVEDAPH
jgi:rod shape-determining protein MreC